MLDKGHSDRTPLTSSRIEERSVDLPFELGPYFSTLRRHWVMIASLLLACLGAAMAFLNLATPYYSATAVLMLDTRRLQPLQPQQSFSNEATLEAAAIETQVKLLQSNTIATGVIERLGLDSDPEFTEQHVNLAYILSYLYSFFDLRSAPSTEQASRQAVTLSRFSQNLSVKRDGRSYVIEVAFTSKDRLKAIQIANAISNVYIQDQLQRRYSLSQQATDWLNSRIEQLRQQAADADRAISEFRSRNNTSTREAQLELGVLESRARTFRTLHDDFLQKAVESNQQQSAPGAEARIITEADLSTSSRTYPRPFMVMTLASFLGVGIGCGAAFAREILNTTFRTRGDVEQMLGVECIAIVPFIGKAKSRTSRNKEEASDLANKVLPENVGMGRYVATAPFSRFAETIRSIKVAVDTTPTPNRARVVGIASAIPGEGKSVISVNLAQLIALSGRSVLIIDGDLRKIPYESSRNRRRSSGVVSTLTESIAPSAEIGTLEVLSGTVELLDAVWHDPITKMNFLPSVRNTSILNSHELLGSERMGTLINRALQYYDYIVIDFPPLGPVVDAKAAAHFIDTFVFVIEWGQTPQQVVLEVLRASDAIATKLLGVVLNKASASELERLEPQRGRGYEQYWATSA